MRFVVIVSQKYRTLTVTAIPKIWDFVFRNNYKRCQLGIPLHRRKRTTFGYRLTARGVPKAHTACAACYCTLGTLSDCGTRVRPR